MLGSGMNLLYRYLVPGDFARHQGFYHEDPLIDEFTYGEGGRYPDTIRNHLGIGNYVFFHTSINRQRFITAYYVINDIMDGSKARRDPKIRIKYKNPHIHSRFLGDVIIFGDPLRSKDLRGNPLLFDRSLAQKLQFASGRKIQFKVKDKNGKTRSEHECIASATRTPRILTVEDVNLLLQEISKLGIKTKTSSP